MTNDRKETNLLLTNQFNQRLNLFLTRQWRSRSIHFSNSLISFSEKAPRKRLAVCPNVRGISIIPRVALCAPSAFPRG